LLEPNVEQEQVGLQPLGEQHGFISIVGLTSITNNGCGFKRRCKSARNST
jgi:hypothetical protein